MHVVVSKAKRAQLDRRIFTILLALYFVVLYPILRADRYYSDDMKRALIGRTGWDSTGRPLTTLLMKLLQCYNHALVDISPLPQLGAIAILAWVGVWIARRYQIGSPWMAALVALPLGAQPFFLENLSYKFDALSMSLAILFALLPILVLKHDRRGWWLGVLSLFICLNFYQSAINVYLIFILLDLVLAQLHQRTPRQLMTQLFSRAMQAGLGMLIYKLLIGIHVNGWVKRKSEAIHSWHDLQLIPTNFAKFYGFIGESFSQQWWLYFGPLLALFALFPVVVGMRYAITLRASLSLWKVVALFTGSLFIPLIALACLLGPMLALLDPPIVSRVLIGVGALLVTALILMQAVLREWRRSSRWALSAAGMLALGMCVIASAYGNALGEQKSYEERHVLRLADDLAELRASHAIDTYLLDGSSGYSPVTKHVAGEFPMIDRLVRIYLSANDTFHTGMFLSFYISDTAYIERTSAEKTQVIQAVLAETCHMPATRHASAYDLYVVGKTAAVVLRSERTVDCDLADADR